MRGFGFKSLLLRVGLGAAVGSVIRGLPPTGGSRLLFPLLCGLISLALLTLQSAAWTAMKSDGETQRRWRTVASRAWWGVVVCLSVAILVSVALQPAMLESFQIDPAISVFAVIVLAGLMGARLCMNVNFDLGAVAGSSCIIAGLLVAILRQV